MKRAIDPVHLLSSSFRQQPPPIISTKTSSCSESSSKTSSIRRHRISLPFTPEIERKTRDPLLLQHAFDEAFFKLSATDDGGLPQAWIEKPRFPAYVRVSTGGQGARRQALKGYEARFTGWKRPDEKFSPEEEKETSGALHASSNSPSFDAVTGQESSLETLTFLIAHSLT